MTSKHEKHEKQKERDGVIKDEKDAEEAYQSERDTQPQPSGPVQPGANEPDTQPPSVVGTTQDQNRKPEADTTEKSEE